MKKGLSLLVLVLLIALLTATPALAMNDASTFTFGGTIEAIGEGTITIQTVTGRSVTVNVTDNTAYLGWTTDGRLPITFDEVAVDDTANIRGTLEGDLYYAEVVTVDVPRSCTQ